MPGMVGSHENWGKFKCHKWGELLRHSHLLTGTAGAGGVDAHKGVLPGAQLEQRLRTETEALKRDWHLARVWLGPEGGGPVVDGDFERSLIPPDAGAKHLLAVKQGERLEVADASVFVGRRRELKEALRFLAGREKAGLLLHGMGRLGKSSLAGRIIDRRPDLTPVVVFAAYDALSVLEALAKAMEAHEPAARLIAERRPLVRADPAALRPLLVQLLSGPCKWANDGGKPLLLLVDDLERVLEADPAGRRHRVRADMETVVRPVLAALLHAFTPQRSHSRLVLTSRYRFQLVEDGRDLADGLADLELSEFSDTSRRKLALRQIKAARAPQDGPALDEAGLTALLPLLEQALALARGNPGLQDLLGSDFVLRPAAPLERVEAVLAEMAEYLQGGTLPKTEEVRTFLQNLAIDALLDLAGPATRDLLRAMTLFGLPVPEAALTAFAELGGDARRLRDLGLVVPAEDLVAVRVALAVNGLADGRLTPLTASEQATLAELALPTLFALWGGAEGRLRRPYAADIELTRLALLAGDVSVLQVCADIAVHGLAEDGWPAGAGELGQRVIEAIETAGEQPSLSLLAVTARALQTAGEGPAAEAVLAKGAAQTGADAEPEDLGQLSSFLFAQGNRQEQAGDLDAAMATFERLCEVETRRANERQLAVARNSIADILQARGELGEALRIRTEELLPVFQRLGDIREVAITQGHIADILQVRGELDEALRIRTDAELPVFQRLGHLRDVAVTQAKIADILRARGELDEALRIYTEELLPIFQRLGHIRDIAITQGRIADILKARGELDEALRIHTQEQLPVYRRLGDIREVAVTQGQIADILQALGELDEPLRIRTEEELPVYRRLGDVHSVAVTQGQIADILRARGELDEALRIRTEEQLPVYQRLGNIREVAITQGRIADILWARGKIDEALALQEERLATCRRLGDIDGIAASLWSIAQIELEREQFEQAFPRLAEAWPLIVKLGRPDGIAFVGRVFGQFLAAADMLDEARNVLGQAAAASRKLGQAAQAAEIEAMMADINKRQR